MVDTATTIKVLTTMEQAKEEMENTRTVTIKLITMGTRTVTTIITMQDLSHIQCFKCKQMGHYSTECPERKTEVAAKSNSLEKGHMNHVHVEENSINLVW